jgi:DNA-directed RNA polymerase II subunit RPB1
MKKGVFDDIFCYELDDENWRPTYILPEHVDHSKTIHEFINVFEAEVQNLEADQFQLKTWDLYCIFFKLSTCSRSTHQF